METVNISELDLNGLLFANFRDAMPLSECRERLELLVYEVWEEDCAGCETDEERPPLALTPYLVFRALMRKSLRDCRKLTGDLRRKCLDWCWQARRESLSKTKTSTKTTTTERNR